jgi:fumarylacetoacetate (FAA) hydrolase family protein
MMSLSAATILPEDQAAGALAGRIWLPAAFGPSVVAIRESGVYDITSQYPTVSLLAEQANPAAA